MKKTDEEILFPDVKVGKVVVKPWSFGVLFEISDLVDSVLNKMESKNLGFDSLFTSDLSPLVNCLPLHPLKY